VLVMDPASLQTITSISIPKAIMVLSLAIDPAHKRLYANLYQHIAILDPVNWKVLSSFDTKDNYLTLVANPSNDTVLTNGYESSTNSSYLIAFDPSGAERGRVQIGRDPREAVISADGARVYVANSFSNDVSMIDPRTMTSIATIPVEKEPYGLLLDENAHRLYVANYSSDCIDAIDTRTNQIAATLPLAMLPTALAADESTGRVFVANASTGSVFVLEGTRIVKEIPVGHHPLDLAVDALSGQVYIANAAGGALSILRESDFGVQTTQPITHSLTAVAVDPIGSRVFAANLVLDSKTLAPVAKLALKGAVVGWEVTPDWIRVNPHNGRVYAVASNGTPGSNSRIVTYSIDGKTLQQRAMLSSYGNVTALDIDP
jgi:serine/threonine protein kinase, bacterial